MQTAVRRLAPPKSLRPDPFWELQWHPAGGGRVRRLTVTRRRLNRWCLTVGLATTLLTVGGSWAQLTRGQRQIERAQGETRALQTEQARLRESGFEFASRLIVVVEASAPADCAYQPRLSLPSLQADNASVLAWLVAQQAPLQQLAADVAPPRDEQQASWSSADPLLLAAQSSVFDGFGHR